MENIWVVAADSVHARLFRAEHITGPLCEIRDMVNPESRLDERELVTDGPGRTLSSGGGRPEHRYTYDQRSEKDHRAERFAGEVIDEIEKLRTRGELERLHVLAEPSFLGKLRGHYPSALKKCVVEEIPNHATQRRPEEIRELLPYRM
ncbi:MAG TPA: host attachment protein [Gammaproteobacteria bacterium]